MSRRETLTRDIHVTTLRHSTTGLLMAISDDLKGLLVPGRSQEDIREKLPAAIKELLEAEGFVVGKVETTEEDNGIPKNFQTPVFLAKAELCAE